MEGVVKQISQDISKLWDAPTRERVDGVIQVFLNRRNKNNRMLLLGLRDNSYVVNQLGFSADDFIKDEAKYLIKILQSNIDSVMVSFDRMTTPVSVERRQDIKDLYRYYENKYSVDIDLAIDEGKLPLLKIQHGIDWLTLNKHKCLVSLMGEGVVDNLTITTKHRGGENLQSSISELYIIPRDNWTLSENGANNDKSDGEYQRYWDYQSTKHASIDNPKMFNFVILNNENDHLIRVFSELMSDYRHEYSINSESVSLLKRVFFIQDQNLLAESRFFENNKEDAEVFKGLRNDICSLENTICDIEAYSDLLEIVIECKYQFADISPQKLEVINNSYSKGLGSIRRSLNYVSQILEEYDDLYKQMNRNDFYTDANDNRDKFYDALKSSLHKRMQFAEKFGRDYFSKLQPLLEKVDTEKETMCKKKSGILSLVMSYEVGKKDFQQHVDSWRSNLNSLNQTMTSFISVTDWDDLVQKMKYAEALLPSMELTLSPTNRIAVDIEKLKNDYKETLIFLKDKIRRISDNISHEMILNDTVGGMINDLSASDRLNNSDVLSRLEENIEIVKSQENIEKFLRDLIRNAIVNLAS